MTPSPPTRLDLRVRLRVRGASRAPAAAPAPSAAAAPAAAQSVDRFDGTYTGTLCKVVRDGSMPCWTVSLTSRHGALSATWSNRSSPAKAQAAGAIAADGSAKLALDAVDAAGKPITGAMTGQWANDALTFTGTRDDGTAANATLRRSPESTVSPATGRAAGTRRVERRP